ncbi:MAG: 50S ribosomal protein L35 [Patescibacteria group bacterium]
MKGFKTNKSYKKRLRVTRTGKILGRKSGQDHFNAKKRRQKQLSQKRPTVLALTNKNLSRYLP